MLVALTAVPGAAHALGLGPLEVRSSLGEPLQAVAPLHIGANESVEKIETSLADRQTYRDFGMSPPALATRLRLQVVPDPRPHITITSVEPVRAPMFNLLVRAGEQGTALLKEYTLALDPPGQGANEPKGGMGERAASTPQPVVKAGPEPETKEAKQGAGGAPGVPRPKVAVTEGWAKRDRYGPVRRGDTLATIVDRLRREGSVPQASAVAATWAANEDAFIDGNMNLIRQGAVLTMPDEDTVRSYSRQKAKTVIARHRKAWQASNGREPTNVGHQRYSLKVSLGEEGAQASTTRGRDGAADSSKPEVSRSGQTGASDSAEVGEEAKPNTEQEADTANGGATPEQANGAKDAADSGAGEEGKVATEVADLRQRIRDLQQAVAEDGSEPGEKVKALEDRISGLKGQVQEQKAVLQKQSRALTQLNQRPSRDRQTQPLLWALGALNLLLIAALGVLGAWLVRGNRRQSPPSGGPDEGGAQAAPASGVTSGRSAKGEEADPFTQVERHLAEGDTSGAKSVLEGAIRADPWNWALYDRLLTLLERDGEGERFEDAAERLFRQLGQAHQDWQAAIRQRGRRLLPNSPVFAEPASPEAANENEEVAESGSEEEELVFPGFEEGAAEPEPASESTEQADAEEADRDAQPVTDADDDLVLTLDDSDAQAPAQEPEEVPSATGSGQASADESLAFSFELEDESEDSGATPEADADQPEDEMTVKLDLAQAWLDMGDADSARPLLQEVVANGDSDQQDQARQKLASLG